MLGVSLAIGCALIWSLSVVMFKKAGDPTNPILLNLLKNTLGFVLMIPTAYLLEGSWPAALDGAHLTILVISGILGIGIADALVLRALKDLGASRLAIVECTYSPFVIILSLIFLGELMTPARAFGGLLVVTALVLVCWSREALAERGPAVRRGMVWATAGLFSMAAGIVMIKPVFDHVPLFWLILVRLGAGSVASAIMFLFVKDKARELRLITDSPRRGMLFIACLLSAYVSMILWVAGYKYNDAGTTAILNQTSTIFTVVLAAILLKERLTTIKVVGTALAVVGVLVMALV